MKMMYKYGYMGQQVWHEIHGTTGLTGFARVLGVYRHVNQESDIQAIRRLQAVHKNTTHRDKTSQEMEQHAE